MADREITYAPRAQRDLESIPTADARRILEDLELLRKPPRPPRKVQRHRGTEFWEIKTGNFRTIFRPQGPKVVILRVVNRRDLELTLGRIDLAALLAWLRGNR